MADSNGTYRSDDQYQYGRQPKLPASAVPPDYPNMNETPARPPQTRAQLSGRLRAQFEAQLEEARDWNARKDDLAAEFESRPKGVSL